MRITRWNRTSLAALVPWLALFGCGTNVDTGDPGGMEPVVTKRGALVTTTYEDHSASPVHVQVKSCRSDTLQEFQMVECMVDSGYALVGGGAYADGAGPGALLFLSGPSDDGRTWRGGSRDHLAYDAHQLTTYAIGLRLDGVSAAVLRSQLQGFTNLEPSVPVAWPSASVPAHALGMHGGAEVVTSGAGQFLTTVNIGAMASKDHFVSSPGQIRVFANWLNGTFGSGTIFEGFGALEAQYPSGGTTTVSSGIGTSTGTVSAGWALAAYGGASTFTSGPGRMLFRVGLMNDARNVIVESKDHLGYSAGTTTASWTQVRKVPGSHGLCNPGGPLASSMDPCVANICAADSYCCNNWWDGICVHEVESICGRSCWDHTCSQPSFHPEFWNDGYGTNAVQMKNYCYNYATNRRTDSYAKPGRASGQEADQGHYDVASLTKWLEADGLIPTTLAAGCQNNRSLIAMVLAPIVPDYHFLRRDADGTWSHKNGFTAAKNTDNSDIVITDPEATTSWNNLWPYNVFGGYFCVCSSSTEGEGHSVIY